MIIAKKMLLITKFPELDFLLKKFIFVDNDFLSFLFENKIAWKEFTKLVDRQNVLVDPLIEFEFIRDIFIPKQRKIRENFLHLDIFGPVVNTQDIFIKIQNNALCLSKIYSHNSSGSKRSSLVDLFLAGRLMLNWNSSVIITGNKKDFPSVIFDLIGVINSEQYTDESIKSFSVLTFNPDKLKNCLVRLDKIKE